MGLVQPFMLWGALLVGVPIIIYLINRRRYQRRPWAAMEFLLRALRKHRRRLQLENLLLLLIRIAVILLLAVAMARPFLRSTAIGVVTDKQENWIFAVDTSYSMGYRDGPRSLLHHAREGVSRMIHDLVKPHDLVAIATLDRDPQVLLAPELVTETNRSELLEVLLNLKPSSTALRLTDSLLNLRDLASRFEGSPGEAIAVVPKKIILFSDFQKKDWLGESGPRDPVVLDLVKDIRESGGEISLGKLNASGPNLSILDLSVSPDLVATDVWCQIRTTVRNWSQEDLDQLELSLKIDGQAETAQILRLGAGETLTTPAVSYRFTEPGYHSVTVEIRSDGLVADNRRFLAVQVHDQASILLVDGDPGAGPLERETLHLNAALAPGYNEATRASEGRLTAYRPLVVGEDQLQDFQLRDFLLVILANVSSVSQRSLSELLSYVRDGGAMMVFLGNNVDPVEYNRAFFRDGEGPLPLRMEEVRGDSRSSYHLVEGDPEHPLVRYFQERRDVTSILQEEGIVEFRQFFRFSPPPAASETPGDSRAEPRTLPVRIPFYFSDPERSPAIFDAMYGRGRTLWIASTADAKWNEFPKWPDFVAFLYQAIPYLVSFGETRINISLGEPFHQVFDAADYAPDVMLMLPDSGGSVSKPMTKIEGENRFEISHDETGTPGIYELLVSVSSPVSSPLGPPKGTVDDGTGAGDGTGTGDRTGGISPLLKRQFFSVNLDPREGDLRSLSPEELEEHFSALEATFFDARRDLVELGTKTGVSRGTEAWRAVLWAVFILLLLETFLAQLFGRKQR